MDTTSFRILDIVMSMITEGEFTVIDKADIVAQFGNPIENEELDSIMENLQLHDMIVVRYTDDVVYGIASRPKGKLAYEKNKLLIKNIKDSQEVLSSDLTASSFMGVLSPQEKLPAVTTNAISYAKVAIICAISSFFGGIVASIIGFFVTRIL